MQRFHIVMVRIGQDIEAICGKCGDVWHVVMAMNGEKIAKVQCKQCGGLHRYRPSADAPAQLAQRSTLKKAAARSSSGGAGRTGARKASKKAAPAVEPNDRPPQRYSPRTRFEVGDTVQHPTFGTGVVQTLPAPGKMQVRFQAGSEKLLVHGR